MKDDCIFCKIAKHEVPAKIEYESDLSVVFHDLHPQAPLHLLVIPKKHIMEFSTLKKGETNILTDLHNSILKMITIFQLDKKGYRIVTNGGGAQGVNHFHIHLLGEIFTTRNL